jgi:signal transduction histidine kinase
MSKSFPKLQDQYACALRHYLDSGGEDALHTAYELGREAITGGLGVLDMVKIHHQASVTSRLTAITSRDDKRQTEAVETFFMEALSPFEAHHRGFREANDRLRELSSKILNAQEEERKRISRELHDEVGQALTAIGINLQLLRQNAVEDGKSLDTHIAEIQRMLELTMENVHRFSYELRPAMLDDLGLVSALHCYTRAFAKRTGIEVRFSSDGAVEHLDPDPKTVMYRVAQESLTNVYKYAHASRVQVRLQSLPEGIGLTVKDNGRGFQPDQLNNGLKEKSGLGLMGMEERLRLVNGAFTVESQPGYGTTIQAMIPFGPGRPEARLTL